MRKSATREQLCDAVARNLREFGYPDARGDNVLTVYLFGQFAKSQLKEHAEKYPEDAAVIAPMIDEIGRLKL